MRKQSPLFLSEEVIKCLCWMHFPLACQQVLKSSVGIIDPVPSGGHYIPGAHLLQWQTLYNAYAHKHTCIQAQKHPLAFKTQTYAHRHTRWHFSAFFSVVGKHAVSLQNGCIGCFSLAMQPSPVMLKKIYPGVTCSINGNQDWNRGLRPKGMQTIEGWLFTLH